MDQESQDRLYMQRALRLAARGRGLVEPNPMVGAVLVKGGRIIGEGYHRRFGGPHAEVLALEAARSGGFDPAGATLYVTLEPCAHHGKTPPCAPALVRAGVARVVTAMLDPLRERHAAEAQGPGGRTGLEVLRAAGIPVEVGLCGGAAAMLNAPFLKLAATGLPLVIAKWAMSLDGRIATRTGASRWISGAASRRLVHELRGRVDAVVIGVGTALRDDPLLTCREAPARRVAARVVLCGRRVPEAGSRLVRTARRVPVVLAYPEPRPPRGLEALGAAGCELLPVPAGAADGARVDPRCLLEALARRGATSVLVEGGAEVLGSFFERRLVDRALVFVAPLVIGGRQAVGAVGGRGPEGLEEALCAPGETAPWSEDDMPSAPQTRVRVLGRDVLLDAWLRDPRAWAPSATGTGGPRGRRSRWSWAPF